MSAQSLEAAGSRRRAITVLLLVLVVLSVPALVRATDSLKQSQAPLLRLNRGFNGPETKSRLTPPAVQPLEAPEADRSSVPDASRAAPLDEPLPDRLFGHTLDTLRGPPARLGTPHA